MHMLGNVILMSLCVSTLADCHEVLLYDPNRAHTIMLFHREQESHFQKYNDNSEGLSF